MSSMVDDELVIDCRGADAVFSLIYAVIVLVDTYECTERVASFCAYVCEIRYCILARYGMTKHLRHGVHSSVCPPLRRTYST
jgi:hypothetical protein